MKIKPQNIARENIRLSKQCKSYWENLTVLGRLEKFAKFKVKKKFYSLFPVKNDGDLTAVSH